MPDADQQQQTGGSPADVAELERRLAGWRPDHVGTLMFLRDGDRVLLIRKRRGHGAGKINGPGGKPEPGEAPLACALRETREETGLVVADAQLAGLFRFLDTDGADWLGYVFLADRHTGTPRITAEAVPAWHPCAALPWHEMWEDDRLWLPRLLAGERLEGEFLFSGGRLTAHRLRPLRTQAPGSA